MATGRLAIDVIESEGDLGDDSEGTGAGCEHLIVDAVAQGGYKRVDAARHLLDDQRMGRRFEAWVNLNVIAPRAKKFNRLAVDVGRCKNPEDHGRHFKPSRFRMES